MDSFEFNKLIGALLATVFVVFSIGLLSDGIFAAPRPEKPGYGIEAAEEEAPAAGAGAADTAAESIIPLLASASVDNGAAIFKKCGACHIDDQSGANKVGPNLWGVVGRPIAAHEGFSYSAAIKDFSQGGSVHWDYDHLDHFLTSPKGLIKGTAMGFAGLKKVQERADVIAYLRTKADSPVPLPDAAAAPAPENAAAPADAAKPAEGAAPADTPPADAAPADAAKPAGDAAPADATKPADGAAAPADAAKPADATAPAAPAKPADGAPADASKPADGAPAPADAAPADAAKPADGATPAPPADAAKPAAPADATAPAPAQ